MKTDRNMKKEIKRFSRRNREIIWLVLAALAVLVFFQREMAMKLFWAVLLAAVPTAAVCLVICLALLEIEDQKRRRKRKSARQERTADGRQNAMREKDVPAQVRAWYLGYGKARLIRLVSELEKEGVRAVWIRPDGVCNVSTSKGYRRRAVLSGYPKEYAEAVAGWIRKDRIAAARKDGKYLRLTFGTERRAA